MYKLVKMRLCRAQTDYHLKRSERDCNNADGTSRK